MEVINVLKLDKKNRHKQGKIFIIANEISSLLDHFFPRTIDVADLFYASHKNNHKKLNQDNYDAEKRTSRLSTLISNAQINADSLLKYNLFTFENYIVAGGWFTRRFAGDSDIDIFIYKDHEETLCMLFLSL